MKKLKNEFDIYKELSKIETATISKSGKDIQKALSNRSIKGFLKQKILQRELNVKLEKENISYFAKQKKPKSNIAQELDKLCCISNVKVFEDANRELDCINKDYEDMLRKMNEKKKKYTIDNKLTRKECIEHFFRLQDKYKINEELLEYIKSEKKRSPPILKYNPNYNAIFPHVPLVKLKKQNLKKIKTTKNMFVTTSGMINEKTDINNDNKVHVMSFEKYSPRKDFIAENKPFSDSLIQVNKLQRNISAPNFSKMCSREEKKRIDTRLPGIIDYSPNYEAIMPNSQIFVDEKKKKELNDKKKVIRKLWGSFEAPTNYIVITKLNENMNY